MMRTRQRKSARVRSAAQKYGLTVRTMRRKLANYKAAGLAGLVDSSTTRSYERRVDPRWDKACLMVLAELVYASTPTKSAVIRRAQRYLDEEYGPGSVPIPSRAVAYLRLDELSKGKQAFGQAKARRSIAERPEGEYGRLRAQYPGEYVLLDSTPLDVFALEEGTGRWMPVELMVAMDLFSRCVVGLRLAPVSTDSRDIADVLYEVVAPPAESTEGLPYHGVPHHVLVSSGAAGEPPGAVPGTIIVDHGRAYLSDHVKGACARVGINIQAATPRKPTDKPALAQTARRTTLCPIQAFNTKTPAGTQAWCSMLRFLESHLNLADPREGMLVDHAELIFERTQGHIASLATLIDGCAHLAITGGDESISEKILTAAVTDNAASNAYTGA